MFREDFDDRERLNVHRPAILPHATLMPMADAIRQVGVSEVTFYRWRKEYGGMKADQLKRLKELEKENERLRRAVSDLTLDKLILAEAAKGNF
jgi:transposase-like protein